MSLVSCGDMHEKEKQVDKWYEVIRPRIVVKLIFSTVPIGRLAGRGSEFGIVWDS
jgi:hypothetical protein